MRGIVIGIRKKLLEEGTRFEKDRESLMLKKSKKETKNGK